MPSPRMTNGPLHAVPCAHCGTAQDLRAADEQKLVEGGRGVICDNCGRTSEIVGVKKVTVVSLRQI